MDGLRYAIQTSLGRKMMSSTLVETVSINYEDFNESFLTCGTCLCMYDGQDHTPKLLPCSHTVCRQCLERIVAAVPQALDVGTFRCPICRETINLPRGGVGALPPSFLVNQLLDLMSRQRREVIPKCSNHPSQELLFCETCDCVFCTICTGGFHGNGDGSCEHTVIPFSIAIKRMSEILLYKAHQCIGKLNKASDNVSDEIRKLDQNVDHTFELINQSFQELSNLLEKRRQELLGTVKKMWEDKKKVLLEQHCIIQAEKSKVQEECEGLQYQVEVRNITKKISGLNAKLDEISSLMEPRENCFVKFEYEFNTALGEFQTALTKFGKVRISKTFPAVCTMMAERATCNLRSTATVMTVDYHGNAQSSGGDPIVAELKTPQCDTVNTNVIDCGDGTYKISFIPPTSGTYKMNVTIFGRPIRGSPLTIEVSEHNNPIVQFGSRGCGTENLSQPVRIVSDRDGRIYITDTGNSRIKVLTAGLEFLRHIECEGLEERSGITIALTPEGTFVVANWRTKQITEIEPSDGKVIKQFSHADLVEPIDITVSVKGAIIVADNGTSQIFIFDSSGKFIRKFGSKGVKPGQFGLVTAIASGLDEEILVADSRIQIFSKLGEFLKIISPDNTVKGIYGGMVIDSRGWMLVTKTEKSKCFIQIFDEQGALQYRIDSNDSKLKRPSGLAVFEDRVIVVDLGNDCVKSYRYK